MEQNKMISIEILRYKSEQDDTPYLQTFRIPYKHDMSVLEALNYIKENMDSSLSYRWSCRMAICGSCGMMINNHPKLACDTFVRDYYPNKITIEALKNFDIEKDLIVDIDPFMEKMSSIKPYVINASTGEKERIDVPEKIPTKRKSFKQEPAKMTKFKQYSMCINCLLCYAACPQMGLNRDFKGPAAIALAHRYNMDSRDDGNDQRIEILNEKSGVWPCTFVGYCSEVCPKSVDPAGAIQQAKLAGSISWGTNLLKKAKKSKENNYES